MDFKIGGIYNKSYLTEYMKYKTNELFHEIDFTKYYYIILDRDYVSGYSLVFEFIPKIKIFSNKDLNVWIKDLIDNNEIVENNFHWLEEDVDISSYDGYMGLCNDSIINQLLEIYSKF